MNNSMVAEIASTTGIPAALAGIFVVVFVLQILGMILWVFKIIEIVRLDDSQFRAAGSEKTNWILVVVLAGFIGALIWHFSGARPRVKAAPVQAAVNYSWHPGAVPAAWYPDPEDASQMRWWDGTQWTHYRSPR
ncbi:MAG: hypothetical protein JWN62_1610 [Acidimicrobiales bacterium]|nr:hypothetical protein [Acidimicrobiales bacterium]